MGLTRFTALFDPQALAGVRAIAALRQVPACRVLNDTAEVLYAALPAEARAEVDRLVESGGRASADT